MSMLAGPRQKQKWSLNPRGKEWTEDSSKFGQRMLEKMGWTSGKGLGANEQGITEHVHISIKNDMAGIGFKKDKIDEAWTEHQDSFNDFLKKLQQDETHNTAHTEESKGALSGKSLELKSKESRARVHYKKFTRGKDVNKYSSKDLANIFGQKELNIYTNNKNKQDENEENFKSTDIQNNRGGVITINNGNMAEYFMKKEHFSSLPRNKNQQENGTRNESEYVGFGFTSISRKVNSDNNEKTREPESMCNYAFENPCVHLDSPETITNYNSVSKSLKKRKSDNESSLSNKIKKLKEDNINENKYENGIVNAGLNLECQVDEVCNGKEFEVSRVQFGLTNTALDLSDELNDKKRVTFNDHVEYSTDCVKKKKNKITLDKFEVENKKAKKKKKHKANVSNSISCGFVNEALNVAETSEEIHDNEINEFKTKNSKKRKESRRSNLETIMEIPEEEKACENESEIKHVKMEDNIPDDFMVQDVSSNKKRKKKHKDKMEIVTENKCNKEEIIGKEIVPKINIKTEKCEISEDQESISKSKKKKKKDKIRDIEPISKDEHIVSETETKVVENIEAEKVKSETVKVKNKKVHKNNDVNDVISETTNVKEETVVSDKEISESTDKSETDNKEEKKHKKFTNKFVNISTNINTLSKGTTKQINNLITSTYPNRFNNKTSHNTWNHRSKMPKRLLMSLFHRNSILDFPGSNIHEIKGYGVDMQ